MKSNVTVDIYLNTGKYYTSVTYESNLQTFESRDQFLEEYSKKSLHYKDKTLVFTVSRGEMENKFVIPFQIEATLESTIEEVSTSEKDLDSDNYPFEVLVQNIISYAKHHQYTIEVISEDDETIESIEIKYEEEKIIIK